MVPIDKPIPDWVLDLLSKLSGGAHLELRPLGFEDADGWQLLILGKPPSVDLGVFKVVIGASTSDILFALYFTPLGPDLSAGLKLASNIAILPSKELTESGAAFSAWGVCAVEVGGEKSELILSVEDLSATDVELGQTGLALRVHGISGKLPIPLPGIDSGTDPWKLSVAEVALLRLTDVEGGPDVLVSAKDFTISSKGISGTITGKVPLDAIGFPADAGATLSLAVKDSAWQGVTLQLTIPGPLVGAVSNLQVIGQIDKYGDVSASAAMVPNPDGWTLFSAGPLALKATLGNIALDGTLDAPRLTASMMVQLKAASLMLAGQLTASVSSKGLSLKGSKFVLSDAATATLGPATVIIREANLNEDKGGLHRARLSASINLHPSLKQGGSVDGLEISWRKNPDNTTTFLGITFEAITIEADTPTLHIRGKVRMLEDPNSPGDKLFEGEVGLELKAAKKRFDARVRIGRRTDPKTGKSDPYILVFVEADLGDKGIRIGTSGVYLYGISLMAGWNQAPTRLPSQKWIAPNWEPERGWYDSKPTGVTPFAKWTYAKDAMVIGAGVTVGTPEGGRAFNGRFLALFLLPGPVVLLEGRANINRDRKDLANPALEPAFGALAAFDFGKREILFGLDAKYAQNDGGSVLTVAGSAAAFFDLDDANSWYLHVGKDQPAAARIAGKIFKLWEATAYLMLEPQGLRTGARLGFKKSANFKVVQIGASLWVAADVDISFKPLHFHGLATIDGKAWLKICGKGLTLSVYSSLEVDVFRPFRIAGQLKVAAKLPWPLPNVNKQIALSWSPPKPVGAGAKSEPATTAATWPPLAIPLEAVSIGHPRATGVWRLDRQSGLTPNLATPEGMIDVAAVDAAPSFLAQPTDGWEVIPGPPPAPDLPRVPVDGRIQLGFGRTMFDAALVGVGDFAGPNVVPVDVIGDPTRPAESPARVRYELVEAELCRWDAQGQRWLVVARKAEQPERNVPGADAAPSPGQLRLFGAWGPYPPLEPYVGIQSQDGKPVAKAGADMRNLWLLSNNPLEFESFSTDPSDVSAPNTDEVTGQEVEAATLRLSFADDEAGDEIASGVAMDGIAASWAPAEWLPIDAVAGANGLRLAGEGKGLIALGQSLLYWIEQTSDGGETSSEQGTEDGPAATDAAAGSGTDHDTGSQDANQAIEAPTVQAGFDGAAPSKPATTAVQTGTWSDPASVKDEHRAPSGRCVTGLHGLTIGCGCQRLLIACCPDASTWPVVPNDDSYGDSDDDHHDHHHDNHHHDENSDENSDEAHDDDHGDDGADDVDDMTDPHHEAQALLTLIGTCVATGWIFDRTIALTLPPAAHNVRVNLEGTGGVVLRLRQAAKWSQPTAHAQIPLVGFAFSDTTAIDAIELVVAGPLWLLRVEVDGDPAIAETSQQIGAQKSTALAQSLQRWGEPSMVLWPHQAYRLRLLTRVSAEPGGLLAKSGAVAETLLLDEEAMFATGGPPGTGTLSPPKAPAAPDDPAMALVAALSTLQPYIAATIPTPTPMPTAAQQAADPGRYDGWQSASAALWAGSDVTVDFDASHIEAMYRLGRRDLGLYLVDASGQTLAAPGLPPGNRGARFATWDAGPAPTDPTAALPQATLDAKWAASLAPLAAKLGKTPADLLRYQRLRAEGLPLPLRQRCEARLLPLLLRETFSPLPLQLAPGTVDLGDGTLPPGWQPIGGTNGWPRWLRTSLPTRMQVHVDLGVADGVTVSGAQGLAADAALLWRDMPDFAGQQLNEPLLWRDVRVSAQLACGDPWAWTATNHPGRVGLLARCNAGASASWRLELDLDQQLLRLTRRLGDTGVELGCIPVAAFAGAPLLLGLEVMETGEIDANTGLGASSRIRCFVDGAAALTIDDAWPQRPAMGTVGLWVDGADVTTFADLRVDDLRPDATPVHRFAVPVAPAVDLQGLLDDHDGTAARLHADKLPPPLPGLDFGAPLAAADLQQALWSALPWPQTPAPPSASETAAFATLLGHLRRLNLPLRLPLERLRVSLFAVPGTAAGVLFEAPMQLDWRRTTWDLVAAGPLPARQHTPATAAAIADVNVGVAAPDGAPFATLLARQPIDLAGAVLERETLGDPLQAAGLPAPRWSMPGPDVYAGPLWRMAAGDAARASFAEVPAANSAFAANGLGLTFNAVATASAPLWTRAVPAENLHLRLRLLLPQGELELLLRAAETDAGVGSCVAVTLHRPTLGAAVEVSAREASAPAGGGTVIWQALANDLGADVAAPAQVASGLWLDLDVVILGGQLAVCVNGVVRWASSAVQRRGPGRIGVHGVTGSFGVTEGCAHTFGPWSGGGAGLTLLEPAAAEGEAPTIRWRQGIGPFAIDESGTLTETARTWSLRAGVLHRARADVSVGATPSTSPTSIALLPEAAAGSDLRVQARLRLDLGAAAGFALRYASASDHVRVMVALDADSGKSRARLQVGALPAQDAAKLPWVTLGLMLEPGQPIALAARIRGDELEVWIGHERVFAGAIGPGYGSRVGLVAAGAGASAFAAVACWPLSLAERALRWGGGREVEPGWRQPAVVSGLALHGWRSTKQANAGLPGTSADWLEQDGWCWPANPGASQHLLSGGLAVGALAIGATLRLQAGRAGVVIAHGPGGTLTLELERGGDGTQGGSGGEELARWRLFARTAGGGMPGSGAKSKNVELAGGDWPSWPDAGEVGLRLVTLVRDGVLSAWAQGEPLCRLRVDQGEIAGLLEGERHAGIAIAGAPMVQVRDIAMFRARDLTDLETAIALDDVAGVAREAVGWRLTWDGAPESTNWSAAAKRSLATGERLRIDLAGLPAGSSSLAAGELAITLQGEAATLALRFVGKAAVATLELRTGATTATLHAELADATRTAPATTWTLTRTADALELRDGAALVAAVPLSSLAALGDGPWAIGLERKGAAPRALLGLSLQAPFFVAVARCPADLAKLAAGARVAIGGTEASTAASPWVTRVAAAPLDAATLPWQGASLQRLRLRDRQGRTLHDADFAARALDQALPSLAGTTGARLLRSADGTAAIALLTGTGTAPQLLAQAKTLRIGLRWRRQVANLKPPAAFAAATPAISSQGALADEVGESMLRVVGPVVIEVIPADVVTITPVEVGGDGGGSP